MKTGRCPKSEESAWEGFSALWCLGSKSAPTRFNIIKKSKKLGPFTLGESSSTVNCPLLSFYMRCKSVKRTLLPFWKCGSLSEYSMFTEHVIRGSSYSMMSKDLFRFTQFFSVVRFTVYYAKKKTSTMVSLTFFLTTITFSAGMYKNGNRNRQLKLPVPSRDLRIKGNRKSNEWMNIQLTSNNQKSTRHTER